MKVKMTVSLVAAGLFLSTHAAGAGAPAEARTPEDPTSIAQPGVVDGATARRLARAGAVVVDVRTPQEYAAGHVAGARNIPFDEIGRRAAEIGPASTPVVLYCQSGRRSGIAATELRKLGYEKLWDAQRYDTWPKGQ